jgi:DNA-binding transcriptional ArsR family regulator
VASREAIPLTHPREEDLDLFAVMAALADPVRRAIVLQLAAEPGLPCGSFALPVCKSAATRHFRVLRESGLIVQWADGIRHRNALRSEELERRFPGLIQLVVTQAGRQ